MDCGNLDEETVYASPLAEELVLTLGLPLANRIVEQLGGQIVFFSPNSKAFSSTDFTQEDIEHITNIFADQFAIPKTIFPPKSTKPEIIRLAEENIMSLGRPNINAIAKQTKTTARWVQKVLQQARQLDDDHPNLF